MTSWWVYLGVGLAAAAALCIGWFDGKREVLVGGRLDAQGHRQIMCRVGKKAAGRELDGRTWDQYPAVTP